VAQGLDSDVSAPVLSRRNRSVTAVTSQWRRLVTESRTSAAETLTAGRAMMKQNAGAAVGHPATALSKEVRAVCWAALECTVLRWR